MPSPRHGLVWSQKQLLRAHCSKVSPLQVRCHSRTFAVHAARQQRWWLCAMHVSAAAMLLHAFSMTPPALGAGSSLRGVVHRLSVRLTASKLAPGQEAVSTRVGRFCRMSDSTAPLVVHRINGQHACELFAAFARVLQRERYQVAGQRLEVMTPEDRRCIEERQLQHAIQPISVGARCRYGFPQVSSAHSLLLQSSTLLTVSTYVSATMYNSES